MGDRANKSEVKCLYIRLPIKIKDEQQVKDLHPDILEVKLRRKIGFEMVLAGNSFIGAPNSGFLKGPTSDDDIELFISEVEADGADDSVYYITDEEVYDDTSYVDDTYDEDDYYFSEADDDDYVDDEDLDVDTDSDSDDTDHDQVVVRLLSDTESLGSDKSIAAASTTQQHDPAADPTNNG